MPYDFSRSNSKSTDKLALLTEAAQKIVASNPEAVKNIKSFKMEWEYVSDCALPVIEIEFYDSGDVKKSIPLTKP